MTYKVRFEPARKLVRMTAEGSEDMTQALDAKHVMIQQQVIAAARAGVDAKVFSGIGSAEHWLEDQDRT